MTSDRPRIRPLEVTPFRQDGQDYVLLRDPSRIAPEPAAVTRTAYFLIAHFDGANTLVDIQAAFTRQFGDILPLEQLSKLIEALDQAYFLDSPRYVERLEQVRSEYRGTRVRPAALAGLAYEN